MGKLTEVFKQSPVGKVSEPETLDDVVMQLELLQADDADVEAIHVAADRLMIKSLDIIIAMGSSGTTPTKAQLEAVQSAYKNVPKWYT